MRAELTGVSFVIPVRNGAPWLNEVLGAVLAQSDGRPMEVIVIDDGSADESMAILDRFSEQVRVLRGERRGASAAVNLGIAQARYPIICQVDQDVVIKPGWMARLVEELESPEVAAAQGWYETDRGSSLWARVMGFELEQRYGKLSGRHVDHVCTGNTAYRADALAAVGGFDERLGYGYDNDLSYRLIEAGYKLAICDEARSFHRWRHTARGYLRQQYGFGFGRLDLVAKHPRRIVGDQVSPLSMMLHAPLMLMVLAMAVASIALWMGGYAWLPPAIAGGAALTWLMSERLFASLAAWWRFRDAATLLFVPAHLLRDAAWAAAIVAWLTLRAFGQRSLPSYSMQPRVALREPAPPRS